MRGAQGARVEAQPFVVATRDASVRIAGGFGRKTEKGLHAG
jgi:hypothetical protein